MTLRAALDIKAGRRLTEQKQAVVSPIYNHRTEASKILKRPDADGSPDISM